MIISNNELMRDHLSVVLSLQIKSSPNNLPETITPEQALQFIHAENVDTLARWQQQHKQEFGIGLVIRNNKLRIKTVWAISVKRWVDNSRSAHNPYPLPFLDWHVDPPDTG